VENPSLTRVRMDIDAYIGAELRWGGVITKVENKADRTWIEIVKRELGSNGRPGNWAATAGRLAAAGAKVVSSPVSINLSIPRYTRAGGR
jgi:starvation-inducible outer membrane lipoprotein